MKYSERKGNLFDVDSSYYLIQCISADFAMGVGIAKEFNEYFNTRSRTRELNPKYMYNDWKPYNKRFDCLKVDSVFNLVTREKEYLKPTYDTLEGSLKMLKLKVEKQNIKKLAMPKIGCDTGGLEWSKVSKIIQNIFKDSDVEIVVYYLK